MRIIPVYERYESKIHVIDKTKSIFRLECGCGDFKYRRLYKVGNKIFSTPCKHLRSGVEALEKQGYVLKGPKPMTGTDKCTVELRKFLIERSKGFCECRCGRKGEEVHRKIAKVDGGKYNEDNCVYLNGECHKAITYQPWHASPGAKSKKKILTDELKSEPTFKMIDIDNINKKSGGKK